MQGQVTVLIACDVRLYSDGIRLLLGREEDIAVVAQADSGDGVLDALRDGAAPDVALIDSTMPDGIAAMQTIRHRHEAIKVVALGVCERDDEIIRCAEAGVAGYVVRAGEAADLVGTVRSAARGEPVCSPRVAATLMRRLARLADERPPAGRDDLTPRQLQVLRLIDQGLSNKEIASRLCISLPTVKSHVHTILEKLGARRRGEASALMRVDYAHALHPRI